MVADSTHHLSVRGTAFPSVVLNDMFISTLEAGANAKAVLSMQRALETGKREFQANLREWRAFASAAEKAARTLGKPIVLDLAIDSLLDLERDIANDLGRVRKLTKACRKALKRHNPVLARRVEPMHERMHETIADYLERLRDLRWETMAAQASADSMPTGPVMSSPSSVRQRLG